MTHLAVILAALAALPAPARAAGLEAVSFDAARAFEAIAIPAGALSGEWKTDRAFKDGGPWAAAAVATAHTTGLPVVATIKGGMNHSPVDLTLNRREWTIKGGINLSPTDLKIDHDRKTITGGANHSPVDLSFQWSTEKIVIEGGANRSPVSLTVDWTAGTITGHASHSPVRVEFDLQKGTAKGYAGLAPVELALDNASGRLTGGMNHSPVDVTLVNCDLSDFLQYFFLFLK